MITIPKVLRLVVAPLLIRTYAAATVLPIGPITFGTNSDYDANFKEASTFNGISRDTNAYLQLLGSSTGTAAFDTSATGGASGQGGTNGSDANNDLSNFTISADVASSVSAGIGAGFLLRLNNSQAAGYVAVVHAASSTSVTFSLGEGASLTSAGTQIFSQTVPLSGLTMATDTFYPFQVTASGGTFSFDFGSHAATASFTDTTVTASVGQVGIVLDTPGVSAATRLENFSIVPEPSCTCLFLVGLIVFACLRKRRGITMRWS